MREVSGNFCAYKERLVELTVCFGKFRKKRRKKKKYINSVHATTLTEVGIKLLYLKAPKAASHLFYHNFSFILLLLISVSTHSGMSPPNESTPLLSGGDGGQDRITTYSGTTATPSPSSTIIKPNGAAVDEEGSPVRSVAEQTQDPDVPLIPGVRLEYIVPAMAVGIFLAAMDNTIVVASYGRIGTDMKELHRTSWISTAYVLIFWVFVYCLVLRLR